MPWLVGLDVLARDAAAADLVDELVALAGVGLEGDLDDGELTGATRLLDVAVLDRLDRLGDRLAVGHLRLADRGVDVELALHAVDEDLEVQLAHAGDDGLAGLFVGAHAERRVLVGQRLQRLAQLVAVVLGLRLDGHVDDRLGEDHPLEDDRVAAIAQRVAGGGVLEAQTGDDVAGHGHVEVLALVGVHQQDAAEALAPLLGGVVDLFALVDRARVDAEVGQLAERVGDDLERQRGERLVLGRLAVEDLVLVVRLGALRRRDVERAGQEVDDGVEHGLDALVLERRAAQDRHEVERQGAGADGALDLGLGDVLAAEVLLHQLVVTGGDGLEQLLAVLVRACSTMSAGMSTSSHLAPSSSSRQMSAFILTRSTRPMNGLLASGPPAPIGQVQHRRHGLPGGS